MRKFIALSLFLLSAIGSPLSAQNLEVKTVADESGLPERFCTAFQAGDHLVSDGEYLILFGGTSRNLQTVLNYPAADALGCIIGFAPAGKNLAGNMLMGAPVVRIDDERKEVNYNSIKILPSKEGEEICVVEATALFQGDSGEKADITTRYRYSPHSGMVEIKSAIQNTGNSPIEKLSFSVYLSAMHRYSFSPFHLERHPDLTFWIYPKKDHFVGLLNQNPIILDDSVQPGTLDPGQSFHLQYSLLADLDGGKMLENIYRMKDIHTEKATIYFETQDRDTTEIIVRHALSRSVFYRAFMDRPFSLEIPLPPGLYNVTANFFPAIREVLFEVEAGHENRVVMNDPPHGTVRIRIQDSEGRFVPGKVIFIGLDPTKSPYFEPENPVESGRRWEYAKNSCFPGEDGLDVQLPVGHYLVNASRGPEYTMETKIVEIFKDESKELIFRIDKVVNTENLISVDPHMHTIYSDGRMDIAERIRSVVAEGVDVAVATDHNYINDYRPTLNKIGLNKYLATIVGCEVTTGGVIHYNTYPVLSRKDEPNNGAINPRRDTATPMFHDSRKNDPEALLQVNHPRSGTIGYFNNFALEPESASTADINLDLNFDVLEVMNGPYFFSNNEQAITDWLNLMNRGYFFPIVASSDSHTIDGGEPGYSRTYVYYTGKKGDGLDAAALIRALKEGHSFATNGPLVNLKVDGRHIPGDMFTVGDGKVDISVDVESAPWISVGEVRLIINGRRRIVFPVDGQSGPVLKFSGRISLPLEKDSYIAAEVLGNKSLFPVHQARARGGLRENATIAYGVTNPVFIDADGNGRFDPPLPKTIHRLEAHDTEMRDGTGK